MDGYLENAMDYVLETFESANQWMKENDFLKFPMVEANFNAYIHPNGGGVTVFLNPGTQSGPSFAPSLGQNNNPASSSIMGSGGSSNSFGSGNGIGQNSFGSGDIFGTGTSGASEPKWEPSPSIDLSKPQVLTEVKFDMFDKMGNMKGMPTMPIPTPEQENKNTDSGSGGGGTSEQETNSGDNTQAGGSSEESKQEAEAAKKMEEQAEKERKERSVIDKIIDGLGQAWTRDENKDFSQDVNKVLDYTGKAMGFQEIVDDFGDDAKKVAKGAGDIFINTVDALGGAAQDLHDMQVGTDSSDMKVKKRDEL